MIAILSQPWAQRLGWTLLHFLWQGALIAAIYAAVRMTPASARARYLIACACLLAMALAPAVRYFWPSGTAAPASAILQTTSEASGSATPVDSPSGPPALPWIVLAWFGGVAACSVRLAGGCLSAVKLRTQRNRPAPPEWQGILERLMVRVRVTRQVRLLVSDRVEAPSVIGWLRPVILAPAGALCGLAPEHLEALLAHELAHIRRHDYLVNMLQGIVESLLFYHPAVWWLSSQIRAEREHCCDDLAVVVSGDVLVYARALAALESSRPAHFQAALAATDGSLVRRIRRLIDPARSAHLRTGSGAVWALSALLLVAIGGVAIRGAHSAPLPPQQPVVDMKTAWPDTVKQGDLSIQVRGLGRVTSTDTVELRIAETHMEGVRVGMAAPIDLRDGHAVYIGHITKIRPSAVNGTVGVDVQVPGLPHDTPLQQQVDGTITIGNLANVVYVGRPVFGKANSEATLFKIEPDGKSAVRVKVQFGAASVNQIQIKSGLQPGDKVILSDMSAYERVDRINLR